MPLLDLKTLFLDFTLTNTISLIFIIMLWLQNKSRYKGLNLIVVCYVLNLLSIVLIFLRGSISDFSSIVLSNAISLFGMFCTLLGLEMFVGIRRKHLFNYLYFVVFIAVQCYFTWISPNMAARNANLAVGFIIISVQSAWLLLFKVPASFRKLTRETGFVYVFFICVNIVRFVNQSYVAQSDLYNHLVLTKFDLYILLLYQISLLMLSFMIIYMINKRLQNDISQEESKLLVAFHSVPYAILITRKSDGLIIDLNNGFELITGHERNRVTGMKTDEIQLWANTSERNVVLSVLQEKQEVHDMEFAFRMKSGEIKTGLLSCINIMYKDEECILSVVYDVTEKKKAEKELKLSRDILKDLLLNLQNEHENEKINLASRIDNNLNQSLSALRINLGLLKKKLKSTNQNINEEILNLVEATYQQTGITIERSLSLMSSMRNEVLYLFGFVEAIRFSSEELTKRNHLTCTLTTNVEEVNLGKNRSFALFNIFQEILNTVLQKNQATCTDIQLDVRNEMMTLKISENGRSFDEYLVVEDGNTMLATLKEKLALVNGIIDIHPKNEDTIITIELGL